MEKIGETNTHVIRKKMATDALFRLSIAECVNASRGSVALAL